MKAEIEQALSRPVCNGWDRGFLESILSQLERGRQLSEKQITTVTKVVLRNGEAAQATHDQWENVYISNHREEAYVLANYYKRTGYFSDLARDILADKVPEMKAYTKMSSNKYAKRVLETYHSDAKYENGTLVEARSGILTKQVFADSSNNWQTSNTAIKAFFHKGGLVIEATNQIRSAAKGAKIYKILPIGSVIPLFVEERHIKLKRK